MVLHQIRTAGAVGYGNTEGGISVGWWFLRECGQRYMSNAVLRRKDVCELIILMQKSANVSQGVQLAFKPLEGRCLFVFRHVSGVPLFGPPSEGQAGSLGSRFRHAFRFIVRIIVAIGCALRNKRHLTCAFALGAYHTQYVPLALAEVFQLRNNGYSASVS